MAEEAEPKAKGGKKKLLFILLGAVVLVLAVAGVLTTLLMGGGKKAEASAEAAVAAPAPDAVVTLEPFVVNLADPRGDRFLKATLRAVVSDPALAAQMQHDVLLVSRIRDRVISVLTSKTYEDIGHNEGKEALREELAREINQMLPNDAVREILLVDFIVQ